MRTVTWSVGTASTVIEIRDDASPAQVREKVQAALDAAAAAAKASGLAATVTLSQGVFVIDGTGNPADGGLRVGSNVTFQGTTANGVKQTTIKLDDAFASAAVTGIVRTENKPGVHDVTVRDLKIEGNGTGNPKDVDGIYAGHAPQTAHDAALAHANITIDNVDVSNCSRYGIDPHEQIRNLTIRNSSSHGNGRDGFTLDYIEGGVIENCVAYDNGRHGFNVVTGSHDLVLRNNVAYGNAENGLVVQPPSQSDGRGLFSHDIAIVGGEYFGNRETGIKINSAKDVNVEGVHVHHNGQYGIQVGIASWTAGTPPASEHIVVAGNLVENNGAPGATGAEIYLKAAQGIAVDAAIYGNRIGSDTSPAPYDIKATSNVKVIADGNVYGHGVPSLSNVTVLDDPKAIGAAAVTTLTGGGDNYSSNTGRQYVDGLGGDDVISTGAGNDTVLGGDGNDRIAGGSGNDTLLGGEGNDIIDGGSGTDWMSGGFGNDRLIGGTGKDVTLGGAGNDTFDFNSVTESAVGANRDVIVDFSQVSGNDDVIDLLGIDANVGLRGDQAFTWLGTGALTGAGQLRCFQSGGVTIIQGSTDADADAEFEIQLTGLVTLTASDFLL